MDLYTVVIVVTLVGFFLLAFILLAPVYLFLKREERASKHWTKESLARRYREQSPGANGTSKKDEQPDGSEPAG